MAAITLELSELSPELRVLIQRRAPVTLITRVGAFPNMLIKEVTATTVTFIEIKVP